MEPSSRVDAKRSELSYLRVARSFNLLLATRGAKRVSVCALHVSERHRHARFGAPRNELELALSRCRECGFDNAKRHRHARFGAPRNELELALSRCRECGFDNAFVELR